MLLPTSFFFYLKSPSKHKLQIEFPERFNSKIIDLSEAELQNLRASIQKLQLQNWHLAQSNSRFLAVRLYAYSNYFSDECSSDTSHILTITVHCFPLAGNQFGEKESKFQNVLN